MSQEIATIDNGRELEEYNFSNVLSPDGALSVANTIKRYSTQNGLVVKIQGRDYPQVEAWQYAGLLLGLFPRVLSVENLSTDGEYKYRAEVAVVKAQTGETVAVGVGICSNKESKKRNFDEYAICSMAQTRATGKAFRLLMGWMFKLAGMETTPAEEMEEQNPEIEHQKPSSQAVISEFKRFAIRALSTCENAKDVESLVKLAPTLKEDAEFIDKARGRYKELANVSK